MLFLNKIAFCDIFNPISHGCSDQRLVTVGSLGPKAILSFFGLF